MPPKGRAKSFFTPETTAAQPARTTAVEEFEIRAAQAPQGVPRDIRVDRIRPNPFQSRRTFTGIEDLVAAIQTQGFISRLRVRPDPTDPQHYQLAYGERRWRAAQQAGLAAVPCDVAAYTDDQMLEFGLIENIQREDLNPVEEGSYFRDLIDQGRYSIRSLAERIGKDKGYIEGRLALARAPVDVQQLVAQRPDSIDAARQIAKLDSVEERAALIDGVLVGQITSRDVRERVRKRSTDPQQSVSASAVQRDLDQLGQILDRWEGLLQSDDTARDLVQRGVSQLIARLERLI
ncbi:MAG: ParB/RepB/Spo0J family partition protein [Chloroflexales bacterium]